MEVFKKHGTKEKLFEMMERVNKITLSESNIIKNKDGEFTLNEPIIGDAVKILSNKPNIIKVNSFNEYENTIKNQNYFSPSHSHAFYSNEEYVNWQNSGNKYTNSDSEKSDILFETGRELVAVWDNMNSIGYVLVKNTNEATEDFNSPESNGLNIPNEHTTNWTPEEIDAAKQSYIDQGIDISNLNNEEFETMMADYQNSLYEESDTPNLDNFEDQIDGGLAAEKKPHEFDKEQLKRGLKVEMEHTNDPLVALEIAMDHIMEDPTYYGSNQEVADDMAQNHAEKEATEKMNEDNMLNNDSLVTGIRNLIDSVDESLSYRDLASVIAEILKEDYGSHNFESFLMELQKHLNI
jgi:hypothetical protein